MAAGSAREEGLAPAARDKAARDKAARDKATLVGEAEGHATLTLLRRLGDAD